MHNIKPPHMLCLQLLHHLLLQHRSFGSCRHYIPLQLPNNYWQPVRHPLGFDNTLNNLCLQLQGQHLCRQMSDQHKCYKLSLISLGTQETLHWRNLYQLQSGSIWSYHFHNSRIQRYHSVLFSRGCHPHRSNKAKIADSNMKCQLFSRLCSQRYRMRSHRCHETRSLQRKICQPSELPVVGLRSGKRHL